MIKSIQEESSRHQEKERENEHLGVKFKRAVERVWGMLWYRSYASCLTAEASLAPLVRGWQTLKTYLSMSRSHHCFHPRDPTAWRDEQTCVKHPRGPGRGAWRSPTNKPARQKHKGEIITRAVLFFFQTVLIIPSNCHSIW